MPTRPTNPNDTQLWDVALALARLGVPVLPCCWPTATGACGCGRGHRVNEIGKAPLTARAHLDASQDENIIRTWWKRWPLANVSVALAPSGLVMVDPDSPEAEAEAQDLGLPVTLVRRSRMTAYLYRRPDGCPLARAVHKGTSDQIDVLSDGYCVLHGTHKESMAVFVQDLTVEPADAPEWVVQILKDALAKTRAPRPTPDPNGPPVRLSERGRRLWRGDLVFDKGSKEVASEGADVNRSASLFRIALVLKGAGATERTLMDALAERDAALFSKFSERRDGGAAEYVRITEKVLAGPEHRARLLGVNGHKPAQEIDDADSGHDDAHLLASFAPNTERGLASFADTDLGNAELLIARHGRDLHYVPLLKSWLVWTGQRWKHDNLVTINSLAAETVRALYAVGVALAKQAAKLAAQAGSGAVSFDPLQDADEKRKKWLTKRRCFCRGRENLRPTPAWWRWSPRRSTSRGCHRPQTGSMLTPTC